MAITTPPTIAALPAAPDPNYRATFNARAYPWAAAQATLATEVSAVAANVYSNASQAETLVNGAMSAGLANVSANAATATTKAGEAATSAANAAAAVASVDFTASSVTTFTHKEMSGCSADGNPIGYRNIPLVPASANALITKVHAGGGLKHPTSDTTARTFTFDSNANQSWDDGTTISILVQNGAGTVTVAVTENTMRLVGHGTTGSRTISANGLGTFIWDVATTTWYATGANVE